MSVCISLCICICISLCICIGKTCKNFVFGERLTRHLHHPRPFGLSAFQRTPWFADSTQMCLCLGSCIFALVNMHRCAEMYLGVGVCTYYVLLWVTLGLVVTKCINHLQTSVCSLCIIHCIRAVSLKCHLGMTFRPQQSPIDWFLLRLVLCCPMRCNASWMHSFHHPEL